ncbi:MAG: hypothetical protein IJ863_05685 [Spirochaetales bacterium]|nr:hypothetical protein [Spirochaetales bacterium]
MGKADELGFSLERTLRRDRPDLHRVFTSNVFILNRILGNYKIMFPEYTDHTILHSMTVLDFCNLIVGVNQVDMLNADEIFILMMASYLHDTGMGITEKDYQTFKDSIDYGDYFKTHPNSTTAEIIRDFHHEFSGLFIRKYAGLFDIPSEEHLFAIVQVSRGHRKTDLLDESQYPLDFKVPSGNTVCLPYLAALIRLADEIDVAASRNPILLYDIESLLNEISILENLKVRAVKALLTTEDSFTLMADTDDDRIYSELQIVRDKMQKTLDYCRTAVNGRTPYTITQTKVLLKRVEEAV